MGEKPATDGLRRLRAAVFRRVGKRAQRWLVRWRSDTFLVGLTGVVLDADGRVLVLEHRYWMGNPCGLPSGLAQHAETWERGFAREVREETGLEVGDVRVLHTRSGLGSRVEVLLVASVQAGTAGVPVADGDEVLLAEFVTVEQARARLREEHVEMLDHALRAQR